MVYNTRSVIKQELGGNDIVMKDVTHSCVPVHTKKTSTIKPIKKIMKKTKKVKLTWEKFLQTTREIPIRRSSEFQTTSTICPCNNPATCIVYRRSHNTFVYEDCIFNEAKLSYRLNCFQEYTPEQEQALKESADLNETINSLEPPPINIVNLSIDNEIEQMFEDMNT
jgi:hypothetical protein